MESDDAFGGRLGVSASESSDYKHDMHINDVKYVSKLPSPSSHHVHIQYDRKCILLYVEHNKHCKLCPPKSFVCC